ncbi:MAG TPA: hypothetical protein VFH53_07315 [Phycisphaerae bacterium]|nr:hypothetical protein [Phycisphaerae bacterium]
MECAACDGEGCEECEGGEVRIGACPLSVIGAETWDAVEAAGFAEKGLLPEPGGTLDQNAKFLSACRFIWAEQAARKYPDTED